MKTNKKGDFGARYQSSYVELHQQIKPHDFPKQRKISNPLKTHTPVSLTRPKNLLHDPPSKKTEQRNPSVSPKESPPNSDVIEQISTSSSDTHDQLVTYCSSCQETDRHILRLVLIGQLSIALIRINIKNGKITPEPLRNVFYLKVPQGTMFYESLDRSIDSDTWPVPESQREFLDTFMKRFADFLEIDASSAMKSIVSILSSSQKTSFDFDLPTLMDISRKGLGEIQDIINRVFWYPKGYEKNTTARTSFDWFSFVEPGCVVPNYTFPYVGSFIVAQDYLSCTHAMENNKYLIKWCISDKSMSLDCCLKLLKVLKKMGIVANDNYIPLQNHKFIFQGHLVHVSRRAGNGKDGEDKK